MRGKRIFCLLWNNNQRQYCQVHYFGNASDVSRKWCTFQLGKANYLNVIPSAYVQTFDTVNYLSAGIAIVPAFSQKAVKQVIKAVEIRDSSFLFGEKFYRVYHSEPFVIYQSQYLFNSFAVRPSYDSTTHQDTLRSDLEKSEWRSYYFVFHKDSSHGLRFEQGGADYNQRFQVDSLLQKIIGTNNYEGILSGKPDTATWNDNRTTLKEVYIGKPQKDTLTASLVLYFSSRMNHISESLNRKLDSAKRLKLYRVEILTNDFYSKKDNQLWPAMKISTTLKDIAVENPTELLTYIDRYKSYYLQAREP